MKPLLLLIIPILSFAWSFTHNDYQNLSPKQLNNLKISYLVGEQRGLGLVLASIAIVETRGSIGNDYNDNHICGVHQIDYRFTTVSCKTIESNSYVSAHLALENLLFWLNGPAKNNLRKALIMYNGGYKPNPHGETYINRIQQVYSVLRYYYKG